MAALSHPWAQHLSVRGRIKISPIMDPPESLPPPLKFANKAAIAPPDPNRARTRRECVTLADVVAFRARHGSGASSPAPGSSDDDFDIVDVLADGLGGMQLAHQPAHRPVLYRCTGATKDKGEWTILEASHFEIFLPDRKDLRFVAVKSTEMSEQESVEGHLFAVFDLKKLPRKLPSLMLQAEYPIVWSATCLNRLESAASDPFQDLIYVAKVLQSGDARAVCNWSPSFITVHAKRFSADCHDEEQKLTENAMYEAAMVDTSSAWVYPVEPPKNRVDYATLVANVRSTSMNTGVFAQSISPMSEPIREMVERRLRLEKIPESGLLNLFGIGIRFRELIRPKESVNVRVRSADPPEIIVLSEVYAIDYVSLIITKKIKNEDGTEEEMQSKLFLTVNSISHPRRGNNRTTILKCAPNGRVKDEFPVFKTTKKPAELPKCKAILESNQRMNITQQSLELIETRLMELENPIGRRPVNTQMPLKPPLLHECLYGEWEKPNPPPLRVPIIRRSDGLIFSPNERQQLAISMYHNMNTPAYCILSPPGSGKTTVASAMAASLVDNRAAFKPGEVQLLLAVQNVAVENLAFSLKSFDENRLRAYYIKSMLRTDAESKAPYNIKELLPNYSTYMADAEDADLITMQKYFECDAVLKAAKTDPAHRISQSKRYKLTLQWHKLLRKAKATLEKYLQPQILLSTVDLALCYLQNRNERGIRRLLNAVTRVVIDEASLLTESTFYCLVRLFPKASFVLIGDDKQLPPFMYDEKVMGHRLTARSALSVALANKNLPVIQLLEVYRAPPRLVDPYNGLSYEGQLVSRKRDDSSAIPLTRAGLVEAGRPQLLLINNPGGHSMGSAKSLWNATEIEALISLLKLLPAEYTNQIMIICLYKEQKKKLEEKLGINYELHTVDSAQGKEKPIVIVLTTRSENRTPFFASKERCTVAVSRQQQALVIIGNHDLLRCEAEAGPWAWSTVLSSAHFTVKPAGDLPPVDDQTKAALAELRIDDGDDVSAVPVIHQPMTYGVTAEEVEEQAAEKQKKKRNRKK